MYGLAALSVAVLVGQAAATAVAGAAPRSPLARRQTTLNPSDIPSQCKNQCAPAVNYLNTCAETVSCLCSDTTNTAFYNCLECVVEVEPSVKSTLQTTLSEYEYNCGTAGAKVSFLTLTFADGSSDAPTATGGASLSTTPTAGTSSNPSANSNPLARNSAGVLGASGASVAGVVGVAMAALLWA
ncbi:hypothetical protein V8D89_000735 [Ganoderma adspersum]